MLGVLAELRFSFLLPSNCIIVNVSTISLQAPKTSRSVTDGTYKTRRPIVLILPWTFQFNFFKLYIYHLTKESGWEKNNREKKWDWRKDINQKKKRWKKILCQHYYQNTKKLTLNCGWLDQHPNSAYEQQVWRFNTEIFLSMNNWNNILVPKGKWKFEQ